MTRIAVVGGGIAGIGAAWLLRDAADVTLFEAEATLGGHVRTLRDGDQFVDTGFIVLNDRNYPQFRAFLDALGIAIQPSDMSFGVSIGQGTIEWAGDSIRKLFAERRLIADRHHWRMIADILRFNRQAKRFIERNWFPESTLGAFLDARGYSRAFQARYLLPMAAAIWSVPTAGVRDFPLAPFLRFFDNHGLLDLKNRPQWYTISGGSHAYVKAAAAMLGDRVHLGNPVSRVRREGDGITLITERGTTQRFDHVIFACHGDATARLLVDSDDEEFAVLSAFRFQPNRAILHSDKRLMPKRRAVWSSWNYLADRAEISGQRVAVTYWMNRLQSIAGEKSYFVTLNPLFEPDPETVIAELSYDHPIFDREAVEAQARLDDIQGRGNLWYCGAWTGHGFHEDGLASATRVANWLGAPAPWLE